MEQINGGMHAQSAVPVMNLSLSLGELHQQDLIVYDSFAV